MYEVTDKFKQYCKRHQRTFKNATITYTDDNGQTQTIDGSKILKLELSVTPYVDYQIIGQAPSKKLHINLYGQGYDMVDKEISVTTTMYYDDNTSEVLNLGTYLVTSDYDSSVKDQSSFTAYDYMIKLDDGYSDEGLEYPCTIKDVLDNICTQKGLTLATTDLPNGNLQVIGNNFQDGATYRDVVKQIAQVNGTFAYIDRSNQLHIDGLMEHTSASAEGTSMTFTGTTAYGNIIDYMLEGNTIQDGTPTPTSPVEVEVVSGKQEITICGKNLVNINDFTLVKGSTRTKTIGFNNVLEAGTYTISWKIANQSGLTSSYAMGWSIRDASNNILVELPYLYEGVTTNSYTFTTSVDFDRMYVFININASDSATITIENIQIEKGTSASSFEKYQGKDYEVHLGKNLANPSNFKFYTQANASCSYDYDTNTLTMTTLVEISSNSLFFCSKIDDSLLKNGKSYTISSTNVSGVVNSLKLQLRNKDGTNASKPQGTTITYDNNYSLFIVGNPFASSGSTIVPQGSVAVIKDIQVEERKCGN